MSKVWVTQEMPNFNYIPAQQYGDIDFLSSMDLSPIKGSINNAAILSEVKGS